MFPTMLLNPWVILGVIATLATSCTTGYVAGRKHEVNKWKAEQAEQLQAQIREREAYLANIAEMVKRYNEKKEKTRVIYREISNQVGDATSGGVCFSQPAVSLWNNALTGKDLLPSTSGRTNDSSSGSSATDTEALNNAVVNFEQYKQCRDQLNAIIDWKEQHYGR